MALALALTLAGFEEEDFRGLIAMFSRDFDRKNFAARTRSPSIRSDSSGVSSIASSIIDSGHDTPSSLSSSSSRSETPNNEAPKIPSKSDTLLRALHKKRDLLNLGENLSDSSWNMKNPSIPRLNDTKSLMANRSIHHRLGANALEKDYPVRVCRYCGFAEPSPYLF